MILDFKLRSQFYNKKFIKNLEDIETLLTTFLRSDTKDCMLSLLFKNPNN